MIRNYLTPSVVTQKGRMKQPQTGIRGTQRKSSEGATLWYTSEGEAGSNYNPPETNKVYNFVYAALADKQTVTLYTDATVTLPVKSLECNQYYYVTYDYDHNYIYAEPIPEIKDESIVQAMTKQFT